MSCSACSARIEKAVGKIIGAENVSVNLLTNSMQVTYDEKIFSEKNIVDAVENAGYGANLKNEKISKKNPVRTIDNEISEMKMRLKWSIIFLIPTIFIAMNKNFFAREDAITFSFSQFLLILPIMYQPKIFYKRLQKFISFRAEYGYFGRSRFGSGGDFRNFFHFSNRSRARHAKFFSRRRIQRDFIF